MSSIIEITSQFLSQLTSMSSKYIPDPASLIEPVVELALAAGEKIMYYYQGDYKVENKPNNSPVTEADICANDIIVSGLKKLNPPLPIVSEEMKLPTFRKRSKWRHFWLIDPLDGTKSFINGGGEFTVNIALIEGTTPVLGVVHSPVEQLTYWGVVGEGAGRIDAKDGSVCRIQVRQIDDSTTRIIAPNFRGKKDVDRFVDAMKADQLECSVGYSSSSVKFCRVAEGRFDVYPSFGVISEWDVAAAHCVVASAGGAVQDFNGHALEYNKRNLWVPPFVAVGDINFPWRNYLPRY